MKNFFYFSLCLILATGILSAQSTISVFPNSAQGIIFPNINDNNPEIKLYKVESNYSFQKNEINVSQIKRLTEPIYKGLVNDLQKIDANCTLYDGKYSVYKINTTDKTISRILPVYPISEKCKQALNETPDWLKKDLSINFELLGTKADDFAELILNAETKIKDEVAFQIANLSIQTLTNSRFLKNINLLVHNAELIYNTAPLLKYVRIKEYSDYTTTEYKIKTTNGDVWREIPRDIYYWYLVMPKLYQEGLWSEDNLNSGQERTYGYFWKDYIWNNPDPQHNYTNVNMKTNVGEVKTIPIFKDVMTRAEYLWDEVKTYKLFGREINDADGAMDMLCNWASRAIPIDADGNQPRAINPNQILYQHRGNCGEDSYLIAAAGRTALIPMVYQGTMREDHAWCGFWDGQWQHCEFFRGGLMQSGWGWTSFDPTFYETLAPDYWVLSLVQGWRADGWQFNNTEPYTKTCNVKLTIFDNATKIPIPDLQVLIFASPGHPGDNSVLYSGMFYTGKDGLVEFKAGDAKYYYVQVYNKTLGYAPGEKNVFRINLALAQANAQYNGIIPIDNFKIPKLNFQKSANPETANYGLKVKLQANEIISNESRNDGQKSRFKFKPDSIDGAVDIFLMDEMNYNKFRSANAFNAYYPYKVNNADVLLALPNENQEWYFVISNKLSLSNYEDITGELTLVEGELKGIEGTIDENDVSGIIQVNNQANDFNISPNPATDYIGVTISNNSKSFYTDNSLKIYSSLGLLIKDFKIGSFEQGSDIIINLNDFEAGVYFIKIDGCQKTKQFVIIR